MLERVVTHPDGGALYFVRTANGDKWTVLERRDSDGAYYFVGVFAPSLPRLARWFRRLLSEVFGLKSPPRDLT